ncbi:hypothetical protein [Microcoleus sp.]|uniref:hypothetical protein n=1 Tax=Microcoleus sp. TaxID=44472 RepID=UPI00352326B6
MGKLRAYFQTTLICKLLPIGLRVEFCQMLNAWWGQDARDISSDFSRMAGCWMLRLLDVG